jgi:hypothetical protein
MAAPKKTTAFQEAFFFITTQPAKIPNKISKIENFYL